MYVGMNSVYLIYDGFRSNVGGAMKPRRANFGHFVSILSLAQLNKLN